MAGSDRTSSANRLAHEVSPYLLQHARNPVDWFPWGNEAIERARGEDKPIFLSIGYSSCHWCHVMAEESFENAEIARLMNKLFVNVKVDREERPDLDRIYMSAVQMMTGSGGWPMSVFLTPDLKPFYGGTYFPPEDRWGHPSFVRVLLGVAEIYRTRREDVVKSGEEVVARIRALSSPGRSDGLLALSTLDSACEALAKSFDRTHGGFGRAPKFPSSASLRLLLRQHRRTGDLGALRMARVTLAAMAAGGIYDHLAGGFHRYSTDERWLIPHFEKMLYDNALLAIAYLDAHEATGDQAFASVARETLEYLSREMTLPEGGFCCSQDAESPEGEGIFHTWTPDEIGAVLDAETADLFSRAYDVDDVGNFEGRCVLHRVRTDREVAAVSGLAEADVSRRLKEARRALHQARERRPKPARDEKVLLDWNGLALSAFARGFRALGEPGFLRAAERGAGFLLSELNDGNGNLRHMWLGGAARVPAFLDDHAALLVGLIDLHEASGNEAWLREASGIFGSMKERFWDAAVGGFFDTGVEQHDLIARTKHAEDSGAPAGNALAALGMIRLARTTRDSEIMALAERTLRCFAHAMETNPSGAAHMLLALDLYLEDSGRV